MAYTYSKIATYTVGSGGIPSVSFLNIPQTYTDLALKVSARMTSTDSPILVNFNGSNTSLAWRRIYGNGTAASSLSGSDGYFLHADTSAMTANTFSSSELYIPNYTSYNYKSVSTDTALETNATAGELFMLASLWSNTEPINRITLTSYSGSIAQYSTFHLYGIKNEV